MQCVNQVNMAESNMEHDGGERKASFLTSENLESRSASMTLELSCLNFSFRGGGLQMVINLFIVQFSGLQPPKRNNRISGELSLQNSLHVVMYICSRCRVVL